ncbi:MAG: nitrilase-related carbon-nitrogen hydrolase, partial [Planctomycetota bacterium]
MSKREWKHGLLRIEAAAPKVSIANPAENAKESLRVAERSDADLLLLPELGLSGYTCGDLFPTRSLQEATLEALDSVRDATAHFPQVMIVGFPLSVRGSLMNVAAVVGGGIIHGIVPKTFLPTYREFYEGRHFSGACEQDPDHVRVAGAEVPFGTDLLFQMAGATIAIEICEDVWMPVPPSSLAAVAGANVLLNLSASNETIGKASWRRDLIRSQSGRCLAAYAYASSGRHESTSDLVFGGHCLIAENGTVLGESRRVGDGIEPILPDQTSVVCDVDLQRLAHDRQVMGSFDDFLSQSPKRFRRVVIPVVDVDPSDGVARTAIPNDLRRRVDAHPFVPDESSELEARCAEILAIQTAGLAKRLSRIPDSLPLTIGVSGGLDSTLALLVAVRTCQQLGRPVTDILGITMPGYGTTKHT